MPKSIRSFTSKTETPQVNPLAGITFDIDGEEFTCDGWMSFLDSSDLARRVADLPTTDLDDLRKLHPQQAATVIGSMSSTLLMALGEAEYARFREYCRKNRVPDEVLIEVIAFINGAIQDSTEERSGRPTGQPSPSSNGEPETAGRMSRIVSSGWGDVTVVPPDGQDAPGPAAAKQPAASTVKTLGSRPPKAPGRRRTG